MGKTIAVVGTLDTKGEEIAVLRDFIMRKGHRALVIDCGIIGIAPYAPDVTREGVALAANKTMHDVVASENEGTAIAIMAEGATRIVRDLYDAEALDGLIGIGGSMGTSLGLAVMSGLPMGFPKLMVSTIAFTPLVTADKVAVDQMMMQAPVDFWGLNVITRQILESAAGAIVGMTEVSEKIVIERPLIAITTRGIMNYVDRIKPALEERGYEVVVIHSVGMVGGRTMEGLVRQGLFTAVLDLCTGEVIEELNKGGLRAGPGRLEGAGEKGIPQIVAPGCMEFWHWPETVETLPADRKSHIHNPLVVGVKATTEEMVNAAAVMAQKLNKSKGTVVILFPLRGFDAHDRPGGSFHDPEGRMKFLATLKEHLIPSIRLVELDMHINDEGFAEKVIEEFDMLMAQDSG